MVPTPVKPTLHPEKLSGTDDAPRTPVENVSYQGFVNAVRKDGVLVFDAAAALARERPSGTSPLYLAWDTHWRPETAEAAARHLFAFIRNTSTCRHARQSATRPSSTTSRASGYRWTVEPADQPVLPARTSADPPNLDADRRAVAPDAAADVLVLGDSFSNIYSVGGMGWGESAGLVEQLSFEMQRPVDRLARNDNGAFASRDMLAAEIRRGRDRLAGKRVVIFQFAARELSFGDWKIVQFEMGDVVTRPRLLCAPTRSGPECYGHRTRNRPCPKTRNSAL